MNLKMHQDVLVDGIPGFVAGIHPNGFGQYIGAGHAYVWIRTPSLDYTELLPKGWVSHCSNGRAVSYSEIDRRIIV